VATNVLIWYPQHPFEHAKKFLPAAMIRPPSPRPTHPPATARPLAASSCPLLALPRRLSRRIRHARAEWAPAAMPARVHHRQESGPGHRRWPPVHCCWPPVSQKGFSSFFEFILNVINLDEIWDSIWVKLTRFDYVRMKMTKFEYVRMKLTRFDIC
jgi:hypothetical protein